MNLQYVRNSELPPLAWLACVENNHTVLTHGDSVECGNGAFVEGAWSGSFKGMGFQEAEWFCGTGGCVDENGITFSTPSHVTYGIYSQKSGGYCISNSLYLLMAQLGYRLDPGYIRYEVDFNSVLEGINGYRRCIRAIDAKGDVSSVNVDYFKLLRIGKDGSYQICNRLASKQFTSFNDYYERLLNAMLAMTKNAADPNRKRKYGMVTTISKGYDAPCCAAIAKKCGCDAAITFKPEGKYAEDCGTEIAKAMGYTHIHEVDANEYLRRDDLVEAEYICSGELGAQISFSSFDKFVIGNMCFTGERGDSVWSRNSLNRNNEFAFEDMLSHLGSSERRLWLDYISVPMPLFGASSWTSIFDISNSEEMKPWFMNNGYDRPIPRRIIEEAGVNRSAFGITKHGAGFVYKFDWLGRILSRMSLTTADSFRDYVKHHKQYKAFEVIKYAWALRRTYVRRMGIRVKTPTPKEYSRIANPMATALLIPWAGEIILEKYRKIIGRE